MTPDPPRRTIGMKRGHGICLIVAQPEHLARRPAGRQQLDEQPGALDIAGQILGRIADIHQRLLDVAPHGGIDPHSAGIYLFEDKLFDFALPADLQHEQGVVSGQKQGTGGVFVQFEPAEAADVIPHIGLNIAGHIVFAILRQVGEDGLRGQAAGGRVPEGERRQPIGVDVFGAFLELGEARQCVARFAVEWIVNFEQHRPVALNDHRVERIHRHQSACPFPAKFKR